MVLYKNTVVFSLGKEPMHIEVGELPVKMTIHAPVKNYRRRVMHHRRIIVV
jgi:hypothetical protein